MKSQALLRGAAILQALVIIILWVALVWYLFGASGNQPAPAVIMMPFLFVSMAVWAMLAAIREDPIVLVMAGGLSFVPIGLFLLLFVPGPFRWIGILDLGLVATGAALLMLDRGGGDELPHAEEQKRGVDVPPEVQPEAVAAPLIREPNLVKTEEPGQPNLPRRAGERGTRVSGAHQQFDR